MQIDKTTFNDISVFHQEEEFSIFHKLNFTRTIGGKDWLRRLFNEPHSDLKKIIGTQTILKTLVPHLDQWPLDISNGTILMIDKFLDYQLDPVPRDANLYNSYWYKWMHSEDFSMIKYSMKHFADFFRGMRRLKELLIPVDLPASFKIYIERIDQLLREPVLKALSESEPGQPFSVQRYLYFAYFIRGQFKNASLELVDIYGHLDAWYSMAVAIRTYRLTFPVFRDQEQPLVEASGLYHILLDKPVAYDLAMDPGHNFLFLTGANMAGKSTLIKAVGSAVFLAHLGMGVPAEKMELTIFDGLLTNINVVDNIAKGESYFYNEVQRIKNTIEKITDGRKWLVLIDELFKGTNVQDAMKCSLAVIKGLIKMKTSLFILSTHLYEIGEELKQYPNITFRFFETNVKEDQLEFSYQLHEGISNDRIGYVILKREKVVDMLENL